MTIVFDGWPETEGQPFHFSYLGMELLMYFAVVKWLFSFQFSKPEGTEEE